MVVLMRRQSEDIADDMEVFRDQLRRSSRALKLCHNKTPFSISQMTRRISFKAHAPPTQVVFVAGPHSCQEDVNVLMARLNKRKIIHTVGIPLGPFGVSQSRI